MVVKTLILITIFSIIACKSTNQSTKQEAPLSASMAAAKVPEPSSDIPNKREFPLNSTINPCDNFYEYTCSLVNQSFKLREDRSSHTFAFSDSQERLLEAKKKFMNQIANDSSGLTKRGKQLSDFFQSCMNEDASKKEEKILVGKIIKEVDSISNREDFINFLSAKMISKDVGFVTFETVANISEPEWYDAIFMSGLQNLPERSYYDKPEVAADFENIMVKFFKEIGRDNPEKRAKELFKFEKAFSQTFPLPVEMREIWNTNTETPRDVFIKNYPELKLGKLIAQFPAKTKIRDLTPKNFAFLNDALKTESLELLKDVYLFQNATSYMDDAYPEFFNAYFEFQNKHMGGPAKRPERSERCTKQIMSNFSLEIDYELLPKIFPNFPTEKFKKLVGKVRQSIINGVEKNTWLSSEAKKMAILKMKKADLLLVKPDSEANWHFKPYAKYSTTARHENGRILHLNMAKENLTDLKSKRNPRRWETGPLTINAWYNPSDNKFTLPIGILQYPFYDPKLPDHVNLGAVGMVIGHELGHGIDDKGSRYDVKGRLKPWMTDSDLNAFKERTQKLVNQFNKIGHNGELTLGENIGDLVGCTFSYNAAFPDNKGTIEQKQDFFKQYGRVWCQVMRPKYRENILKIDSHSLGIARVNEQMKQSPHFAEAFGCKDGSPMTLNNNDRVVVW